MRLGIQTNSLENASQKNETLNKYGEVYRSYCFENRQGKCSIRFRTQDIFVVDKIINLRFVDEIYIDRIESDYELNASEKELSYCESDQDCVIVDSTCCGCSGGGAAITINKKYEAEWNSKQRQECQGFGCLAVMSQHISCYSEPKCVDNGCNLIPTKESVCGSLIFENCKDYVPEEQWNDAQESMEVSCREVIEICE